MYACDECFFKYIIMPNNTNARVGAHGWDMEDVIKQASDLISNIDPDECNYSVHISNSKKPVWDYLELISIGYG
jgi:hypothetical protein